MQCEDLDVQALELDGLDLAAFSGQERLQSSVAWLRLMAERLPSVCGEGVRLSVIVARDEGGIAAAIPAVRTSALAEPRPFPMDVEDLYIGLWARHVGKENRALMRRAYAARVFGAALGRLSPSFRRGLVLHAPLAPATDALVARRLGAHGAAQAVHAALAYARALADEEDRCVLLPRLMQRDAAKWREALAREGFLFSATYPSAELLLQSPQPARTRQMIRRNARLVERAGVTVDLTSHAPEDMPLGALFAETSSRYADPAPRLDNALFRALGERFPERVRFLSARRGGSAVGFVVAFACGEEWEAWKCGVHRSSAGDAPVYLDLVYGKLPEVCAREGGARLALGAGQIALKRHYGASVRAMEAHVAVPRRFVGRKALAAFVRAVGAGIERVGGGD